MGNYLYTLNNKILQHKGLTVDLVGVNPIWNGLTSYWRLDETTGSIAYDSVGGNNGVISGNIRNGSGKNLNCMFFTGDTNNIQVATNGIGKFNNAVFSINAWVNRNTSRPVVIFDYPHTSHNPPYYSTHLRTTGADNRLFYGTNNAGTYQSAQVGDVPATGWVMVTLTSNNNDFKMYVNGTYKTPVVNTITAGVAQTYYATPVRLGNNSNVPSSINSLNGYLDEVSYWNRVLTPTEVTALYASGNGLFY